MQRPEEQFANISLSITEPLVKDSLYLVDRCPLSTKAMHWGSWYSHKQDREEHSSEGSCAFSKGEENKFILKYISSRFG